MRPQRLLVLLAWAQGASFVATGAWPMLHVGSFQATAWRAGPGWWAVSVQPGVPQGDDALVAAEGDRAHAREGGPLRAPGRR